MGYEIVPSRIVNTFCLWFRGWDMEWCRHALLIVFLQFGVLGLIRNSTATYHLFKYCLWCRVWNTELCRHVLLMSHLSYLYYHGCKTD